MTKRTLFLAIASLCIVSGCEIESDLPFSEETSDSGGEEPSQSSNDTVIDTDVIVEVDTDTDINADVDTHADTDSDSDVESDTATNVDTDSDTHSKLTIEESSGFCRVDGEIEGDHQGFGGEGYANTDNAIGNSIEWSVNVAVSGSYRLEWRYASTSDTRPATVFVNNSLLDSLDFVVTGDWTTWMTQSLQATLSAGTNRIELVAGTHEGLVNIDSLSISGAEVTAGICDTDTDPDTNIDSDTDTNTDSNTDTDTDTDTGADARCDPDSIVVTSLKKLLPYLDDDNVKVQLAAGTYQITPEDVSSGLFSDPTLLDISASNSTYCFAGVTLKIETEVFRSFGNVEVIEMALSGSDTAVKHLTVEDLGDATPGKTALGILMDGRDNLVEGFHMTIRGSFPYGYGDAFGKGGGPKIGHHKHSAILVRGLRNHLLNTTVIHRAYGHGIFMQAARSPVIEGCYVEGEIRTTDDMLAEEGTGSPADEIDFDTVWGYRLPAGYTMSLQEGGIRAYDGGTTIVDGQSYSGAAKDVTVLNCTIKNMRTGVTLTHADGFKYVEGTTAIGCERGFAIGSGDIVNCRGDAVYGPVLGFDYSSNKNAKVDITILSNSGAQNGSNCLAYLGGSGHEITLRNSESSVNQSLKLMVSGDSTDIRKLSGATSNQDSLTSSSIEIHNLTNYPMVLDEDSQNCTGESGGPIIDKGSNNEIRSVDVGN